MPQPNPSYRPFKMVGVLLACSILSACSHIKTEDTLVQLAKTNKAELANIVATPTSNQPRQQPQGKFIHTNIGKTQWGFHAPLNCPAHVLKPPTFKTVKKRILVYEGTQQFDSSPAIIEKEPVRVQIHPARHQHEITPAIYKTVVEEVPIRRERSELYATPPTYRTVNKEYVVRPEIMAWKQGCLPTSGSSLNAVKEQCLTIAKPLKNTVKRQLVDLPAIINKKVIPPEIVKVERKVLVKSGTGTGGTIPAEYKTILTERVAKPWRLDVKRTQSKYETIEARVTDKPAYMVRMTALCTDQTTPNDIRRIQSKLREGGQMVTLNGQLDRTTLAAINRFQVQKQLAQGAITVETLQALGF